MALQLAEALQRSAGPYPWFGAAAWRPAAGCLDPFSRAELRAPHQLTIRRGVGRWPAAGGEPRRGTAGARARLASRGWLAGVRRDVRWGPRGAGGDAQTRGVSSDFFFLLIDDALELWASLAVPPYPLAVPCLPCSFSRKIIYLFSLCPSFFLFFFDEICLFIHSVYVRRSSVEKRKGNPPRPPHVVLPPPSCPPFS